MSTKNKKRNKRLARKKAIQWKSCTTKDSMCVLVGVFMAKDRQNRTKNKNCPRGYWAEDNYDKR